MNNKIRNVMYYAITIYKLDSMHVYANRSVAYDKIEHNLKQLKLNDKQLKAVYKLIKK